ncbi:unnamed protein product [Rangifer tarandus platyrhynchus]|uniref:Uncharacterized protein n=2 Tax=Rangifer tarandus platyrhynchus TaxID=3082113 RepID=A0ABN8YUS2_RANTA|nr:unnamed protein product [Rangifer tarandus platyrhynchus]
MPVVSIRQPLSISTCIPSPVLSCQMNPISPKQYLTRVGVRDLPMGPVAWIPPPQGRVWLTSSCPGVVPAQGAWAVCSLGIFGQAARTPHLPESSAWLQPPGNKLPPPTANALFNLWFFFFIWGQKAHDTISFNIRIKFWSSMFFTTLSQLKVHVCIHLVTHLLHSTNI